MYVLGLLLLHLECRDSLKEFVNPLLVHPLPGQLLLEGLHPLLKFLVVGQQLMVVMAVVDLVAELLGQKLVHAFVFKGLP